jgi:hypothetical protein
MTAASRRACRRDLRASVTLVAENYGGYARKLAQLGAEVIHEAQRDALREAESPGPRSCEEILNAWLGVFGEGHLGVILPSAVAGHSPGSLRPEFSILSDSASLIRAPSFASAQRDLLEDLLEQHRSEIVARRSLVIDVRGNTGGNVSTYEGLADLAYVVPVRVVGSDVLATRANIAAWRWMLPHLRADDRAHAQRVITQMETRRGEWVNFLPDAMLRRETVVRQPARIAVLIDAGCGSACERFVHELEQSPKVRLFGGTTRGNLDHGSLRPHPLPSGTLLWLGTTRPHLPESSIDGVGIAPHIAMDPALFEGATRAEALTRVLRELDRAH